MKKINFLFCLILLSANLFAVQTWNILDKSMAAWNVNGGSDYNKAWTLSKGSSLAPANYAVTQGSGYVNVMKTYAAASNNYAFLVPPALTLLTNTSYTIEVKARVKPIDKATYPDAEAGFESNQISARLNGKNLALHLKYGNSNDGYVAVKPAVSHYDEEKYKINTAEWHVYSFVFHADNLAYDVYVDDVVDPIFENVATAAMTGTNIIRLGAESFHRCNMDVEYVKMGTGDFLSKPKITSLNVSSDSHVVNNERTITVRVNTVLINNGEKLLLSFVDKDGVDILTPKEVAVNTDVATTTLTIPATVPLGKYEIKVVAPAGSINGSVVLPKSVNYVVVAESPLDTKILPQVKPVGFTIDIDNYQYKTTSNEFIFPAIIDAKKYTANGKFVNGQDTLARYYRFYTPHENPGGMFLATGPTLDGPWTERNTVIDLNWAKAVPNNIINTAPHISACQVIWNNVYNKYFMYFHGPNSTTHYATSDNLVDWTFGGSVVTATQFTAGGTEASYAKVFEHEIPGLGNKYVMLLMIMENNRKIYWAHSTDGINWTTVRKPLISPDLDYKKIPGTDIKPNYVGSMGSNVAGPYLMENNGRCFVFVNGSAGNISVVEVGLSFDMEVHWGDYLKYSDVVIDKDETGNLIAVPRVAAPVFIQNDAGKWYMFFEAGGRLGANIAYAKEDNNIATSVALTNQNALAVSLYPTVLKKGQQVTINSTGSKIVRVEVFNTQGLKIYGSNLRNDKWIFEPSHSNGLYFVRTTTEDNSVTETKIIVLD